MPAITNQGARNNKPKLPAANDDNDVLAAEFIRTFTSVPFPGKKLLQRYAAERKREHADVGVQKVIPLNEDKILYWGKSTYE